MLTFAGHRLHRLPTRPVRSTDADFVTNIERSDRSRIQAAETDAIVLPFRPKRATDETERGCRTGRVSMSTTGREPYPDDVTDVTDEKSGLIGSRTVGQVVPASRIEALRVERSAASGTIPTIKSMGASTGRGAGSPYLGVLVKSSTLTRPLSGSGAGHLGLLTHLLVATHAPRLTGDVSGADLVPSMLEMAHRLIEASTNRRRAVAAEAVSLARTYLVTCAPAAPWALLGVEFDTGAGPVDVAWQDLDGRVFFDEIKTSRITGGQVAPSWMQQVHRYSKAGRSQFGDAFVGTRLLPLSRMRLARLVTEPFVPSVGLAPTPAEPFRAIGGQR